MSAMQQVDRERRDCFVCHAEGLSAALGNHLQMECPLCGVYRVSQGAIRLFEDGLLMDIDFTRRWIASYQGSPKPPMMATSVALRRIRKH
jgi:hypothetical protein